MMRGLTKVPTVVEKTIMQMRGMTTTTKLTGTSPLKSPMVQMSATIKKALKIGIVAKVTMEVYTRLSRWASQEDFHYVRQLFSLHRVGSGLQT